MQMSYCVGACSVICKWFGGYSLNDGRRHAITERRQSSKYVVIHARTHARAHARTHLLYTDGSVRLNAGDCVVICK